MTEIIGDTNCKHKWKYSDITIDTLPQIKHCVCVWCDKIGLVFIPYNKE